MKILMLFVLTETIAVERHRGPSNIARWLEDGYDLALFYQKKTAISR
jgi:hypothetical protein